MVVADIPFCLNTFSVIGYFCRSDLLYSFDSNSIACSFFVWVGWARPSSRWWFSSGSVK